MAAKSAVIRCSLDCDGGVPGAPTSSRSSAPRSQCVERTAEEAQMRVVAAVPKHRCAIDLFLRTWACVEL